MDVWDTCVTGLTGATFLLAHFTVCWCRALGRIIVYRFFAKADGQTAVFTQASVVQADEVMMGHDVT